LCPSCALQNEKRKKEEFFLKQLEGEAKKLWSIRVDLSEQQTAGILDTIDLLPHTGRREAVGIS
jgi:hypothetical protein